MSCASPRATSSVGSIWTTTWSSILIRLGSRTRKGFGMKAGVLTIRLTKGRYVYLEASTDRLELRLDRGLAPEHRALVVRKVLGLDGLDVPLLEVGKAQMAAIEKLPALAEEDVPGSRTRSGREWRKRPRGKTGAREGERDAGRKLSSWLSSRRSSDQASPRFGWSSRASRFGREFEPGVRSIRSRLRLPRKGSAIFSTGEIGLFTLYPEDLYVRVLRNGDRPRSA